MIPDKMINCEEDTPNHSSIKLPSFCAFAISKLSSVSPLLGSKHIYMI
jgi:hypothetical protein